MVFDNQAEKKLQKITLFKNNLITGRREEAMALLTSLGRQDDIDEILERANEKPKPKMAQLTEMYTVKTNRKAAFLIISLNVLGQFCGMMTVIAFITVIFEMTGSNMEAHISTIVVGATQVFASVIAPVFVDRIGRKILLLLSTGICALSLVSFTFVLLCYFCFTFVLLCYFCFIVLLLFYCLTFLFY